MIDLLILKGDTVCGIDLIQLTTHGRMTEGNGRSGTSPSPSVCPSTANVRIPHWPDDSLAVPWESRNPLKNQSGAGNSSGPQCCQNKTTDRTVSRGRERREGNIWQRKWSGVISLGISLSMGHQAEPRAQRITPLEGTTILSLDDLSRVTRHKAGRIWQSKVEYTDPRAGETPCIAFGSWAGSIHVQKCQLWMWLNR